MRDHPFDHSPDDPFDDDPFDDMDDGPFEDYLLDDPVLRTRFFRLLANGPIDLDTLIGGMDGEPGDPEERELWRDELGAEPRAVVVAGDRVADKVQLLANAWLTHRLTEQDVAAGTIHPGPFLFGLADMADDSIPLARGGRLRVEALTPDLSGHTFGLVPPPGFLDGHSPGDLVGFRLRDGLLELRGPLTPDPDAPSPGPALAAAAERIVASTTTHARVSGQILLFTVLADDPDLLAAPTPPLEELLAEEGWTHDELAVIRDTDTDLHPDDHDGPTTLGRIILLAQATHLDGPSVAGGLEAVLDLRLACHRGETPPAELVAAAGAALADPRVAVPFLNATHADPPAVAMANAVLAADPSDPSGPGAPGNPGALLVLASAAEREGDLSTMEARLRQVVAHDRFEGLAVEALAWLARERGDLAEALRLYRRAGLGGEFEAQELLALSRPDPHGPSRNAPCPCGSGRKFKACHANAPGGSLTRRAPLVRDKLLAFLARPHRADLLEDLAQVRFATMDTSHHPIDLDPLLSDLALFAFGGLEEYLEVHGPLLPDDEAALVRSWADSRLAIWRVLEHKGRRLRLHVQDPAAAVDGRQEVTVAVDESEGPLIETGTPVLARVLDGAGEPVLFNGVMLLDARPLEEMEALIADPAAGAAELCRLLSNDPLWSLVNRDGDPAVACQAFVAVPDPDASLAELAALDELEWAEDDDHAAGLVRLSPPVGPAGEGWVRGQVSAGADDGVEGLVLETNGEARMDQLLAMVAGAVGGEVRWDRRTPMWRVTDDRDRFAPVPAEPDPMGPDAAAAVEAHMREAELAWCDEPVPALGGLTPRQALDHPIGHQQLLDLLDGLPRSPWGFDPDRIRGHLGLPAG